MTKQGNPFNCSHSPVGGLNGSPVQTHCGQLSAPYLQKIDSTLQLATADHPRTLAVRVDLRFPQGAECTDDAVISRFIASLKTKIQADLKAKKRTGARVHPCRLRYIWVREQDSAPLQHYHVLLLLNADTYNCLGNYGAESGNLAYRIRSAWASAIGMPVEEICGSVHFPDNPIYRLDTRSDNYPESYGAVWYRTSYMAKLATKEYGGHVRHFGCSQM